MGFSIHTLSICTVLICVGVTGLLCTMLTVTSGNTALSDTKRTRDKSLTDAFAIGRQGVMNSTRKLLDKTAAEVVTELRGLFKTHRLSAQALIEQVTPRASDDMDYVTSWPFYYSLRRGLWNTFQQLNREGLTSMGIMTQDYKALSIIEDPSTIGRGPDEYHAYMFVLSNGSAYDAQTSRPAAQRPVIAWPVPHTAEPYGWPDATGDLLSGTCNNFGLTAMSNGTLYASPCQLGGLFDIQSTVYNLPTTTPGPGGVQWSPPQVDQHGWALMYLYGTYVHPLIGAKIGQVASSLEIKIVSKFLSEVRTSSEYSRLFCVLRSAYNAGVLPPDEMILTGASHGEVTVPSLPTDSDDSIINQTARHVASLEGSWEGLLGGYLTYSLPTARNANEEFFLKVTPLSDGHGLDWYVCVVVDRAFFLSVVDANIVSTEAAIAQSEASVDSELEKSRTVMYSLICAVAVCLTTAAIALALRLIKPLLELKRDMALVAVMDLERVRLGTTSSIHEVMEMRHSFECMVNNLKEFRNYMPASVLHEVTDGEQEDTQSDTGSMSSYSRSSVAVTRKGSVSTELAAAAPRTELLRRRKVTLAVASVQGFVSNLRDPSLLVNKIKIYLTHVTQACTVHKGVVDEFNGDKVYLNFNAVRALSLHSLAAVSCLRELESSKSVADQFKLSCCVASGEVLCGNVGIQGLKKFTYFGSLVPWFHLMPLVAKQHTDIRVFLDITVAKEVRLNYYVRLVDEVTYKQHSPAPIQLFELMQQTETAFGEEWMYQLHESEEQNPYKVYNIAMEEYLEGNYSRAHDMMKDAPATECYIKLAAAIDRAREGALPQRYLLNLDDMQ